MQKSQIILLINILKEKKSVLIKPMKYGTLGQEEKKLDHQ